ncbi:MAG: hypothetical protein V7746_01935 [Halioglobus sp.]
MNVHIMAIFSLGRTDEDQQIIEHVRAVSPASRQRRYTWKIITVLEGDANAALPPSRGMR